MSPRLNDDLDIQLLWLVALEEKGIELDAPLYLRLLHPWASHRRSYYEMGIY